MDERIVESRSYFGVLSALKCHPVNSLSSELLSQPSQKEVSIITPCSDWETGMCGEEATFPRAASRSVESQEENTDFLKARADGLGGNPCV